MDLSLASSPTALPAGRARLWRGLGALSVSIGLVNAFLPLLPTTIFLLIGAWAYGKGSPELRERLLSHPRYGAALRLWSEKRQLTRRAKWQSSVAIAASYALTLAYAGWSGVTVALAAGLGALVVYLCTRDEPAPGDSR